MVAAGVLVCAAVRRADRATPPRRRCRHRGRSGSHPRRACSGAHRWRLRGRPTQERGRASSGGDPSAPSGGRPEPSGQPCGGRRRRPAVPRPPRWTPGQVHAGQTLLRRPRRRRSSRFRFHDLRHTGAVLAAATGASLAELMGRLGHGTPRPHCAISMWPRIVIRRSPRCCPSSQATDLSDTRGQVATPVPQPVRLTSLVAPPPHSGVAHARIRRCAVDGRSGVARYRVIFAGPLYTRETLILASSAAQLALARPPVSG